MKVRLVIIGNSGSGKSYLAARLSERLSLSVIALDRLFWEPGGFNRKRPEALVLEDIARLKLQPQWIVEGVFGALAARFLDRADCLIWLDVNWETCQQSLLQRGSEKAKQLDPEQAEASFQTLLVWAADYWERDSPNSYRGHQALYAAFPRSKLTLQNRQAVDRLIADAKLPKTAQ